jgi:zona occludens toxin (predicted ATPase)
MGGCGVGLQPAQYHLTILRAANSIQIYNLHKQTQNNKENKSIFELYANTRRVQKKTEFLL